MDVHDLGEWWDLRGTISMRRLGRQPGTHIYTRIYKNPQSIQTIQPTTTTAVTGRVLTYFDRVGTIGMERDYSWPFVPFQAVCVHTEFPGNRATDPNRK